MIAHAHSLPETDDEALWELLSVHLMEVADLCAQFGAPLGAPGLARLAGLLHDIGKNSIEYQAYIRGRESSPDHSTAGAVEAVRGYGMAGKMLAFAIAGHHAGLADGSGYGGTNRPLKDRLADASALPPYAGWKDLAGPWPTLDELRPTRPMRSSISVGFDRAFLTRMLFSCLVDADFLATEAFYANAAGKVVERGGYLDIAALHGRLATYMVDLAGKARSTDVNRLRADILSHAVARADLQPGLFTMTVPTGGGKTLASLSFALNHAARHGLRRVIYVIPFTSIIEQTAEVFRKALGSDRDILEHHGTFDWERRLDKKDGNDRDGIEKLRRSAENWDAPVIVTTAVQFFESLFAARTSRCRKLHHLAESVIVLDEAQTLPLHLLRPCMAAIDELARNYRASVVLCTATQPALRVQDGFPNGLDIPDERELAPDPPNLYQVLKRVRVERLVDPVSDAEIAAAFAGAEQMLCIVNSRAHARDLFEAIRHQPGACHLTTLMCPAHRRAVLAQVRIDLHDKRPVRLVATSLIEAGVDVDFPEVWRAETGLDSIAQAAGRCNREGQRPVLGRTIVFTAADHKTPPVIEQFAGPARSVLRRFAEDPLGLEAIRAYFSDVYWTKGDRALDAATLEGKPFPILTHIAERAATLDFPFASIAAAFRMIDETMQPVIVPWKAEREEIDRLLDALRHADQPPAAVVRKLQQYTVPVPAAVRQRLIGSGAVQAVKAEYGDRFMWLESAGLYDEQTGLSLGDATFRSAEENIIG